MLAGFAITDEFVSTRIQVLLSKPDTLIESRRCRLVQNLHTSAWPFRDVYLIQAGVLIATTRRNNPNRAPRQRIAADGVLAVQFGRGHKLFHPVRSHRIAELRIAKLG